MITYFKTIPYAVRAIDTVFPCDGTDPHSVQLAYDAANEARRELRISAPVSCWRRPSVPGPWDRCAEVAP